MWRPGSRVAGVVAVILLGAAASAAGDELAIVDTHLHYSQNSWQDYAPAALLLLLDRAGVQRAFVSSTPDDGTVRLYEAAPDRIVPVLRPYRQAGELSTWHQDPTVVPYLEQRLARPIYRGIGEFHLVGSEARSPVVRQVAELAARHGLFLHCHCDAEAAEILVGLVPGVRVLWAHAGMSAGADQVARLVGVSADLLVELALRSDVAPGGRLDPAWRDVFVVHADRFMVGTDTWVPSRWAGYVDVQNDTRAWLRELPPAVARRLAVDNAEALARPRP
jgi:predicted TIM-barrel fold metal-dependent hydrolase